MSNYETYETYDRGVRADTYTDGPTAVYEDTYRPAYEAYEPVFPVRRAPRSRRAS